MADQESRAFYVVVLHDLTEAKAAENSLEQFKHTLDNTLDCVFMFDAQTLKFFYLNQGAIDQLDYPRDVLLSMTPVDIKPEFDESRFRSMIAPLQSGETPTLNFETLHRRSDGSELPVDIKLQYMEMLDGTARYVAIVRDITEQREQQKALKRMALYDSLTDLPNRRKILRHLEDAMAVCKARNSFSAVLLIDIDDFKSINDTLGHWIGDEILVSVADRFKREVRFNGRIARLGGDEFLVVLHDLGVDRGEAVKIAELVADRLLARTLEPFADLEAGVKLSASIGVLVFDGEAESTSDLVRKADIAMYDAKTKGKGRKSFFDDPMQQALLKDHALVRDLTLALEAGDQITAWFQPKVNRHGSICGLEALVRWHHPEQGLLTPWHFIETAERNNLIAGLGDKVLLYACQQMALWHDKLDMLDCPVSVNISQKQLAMQDFPERVAAILNTTRLPPELLKLEVTESTFAENIQISIERMLQIQALGVQFSLDDFGTGYSSLSYLQRLPLSEIKIDQSFVASMNEDPQVHAIIKAVIDLSASLDLQVVAEGVEEESHWRALLDLGCQTFQGYFFGRPAPAETIEKLLKENSLGVYPATTDISKRG
jgi:diguanylate cyclase (GGDEF)-like protein/PAS domain S-box-containing protein